MIGKRTQLIFKFLAIVLLLSGCRIYSDLHENYYVPLASLHCKSFAWINDTSDSLKNDSLFSTEIREKFRKHIEKSMVHKGFVLNPGNSDLYLDVLIANEKKEEVVIYPPGMWPLERTYEYLESKIVFLAFDKEKKQIWQCSAAGNFYGISQFNKGYVAARDGS
jgi:hypothetical protein